MILQRCYGGQEDRRWAGDEELRRGQSSPAVVRRGNSGAAQAEVGEEGPGEDPGRAAELLRRLVGAGRHGVAGPWRRREVCAAEQGERARLGFVVAAGWLMGRRGVVRYV
jgi:hypothetical protein